VYDAVERTIETMWRRYHEPLSLSDLADSALLSKFYYSRLFRSQTGTSPGRFLTAIRLSKAKRLLLETPLSVTEISLLVGYNSLGTFTSRFTRSVGVSPARYRVMSAEGAWELAPFPALPESRPVGSVAGWITVPEGTPPSRIYIGAFKDPIAQGVPSACDIRDGSGPYRLDAVPEGRTFIRAAVVAMHDLDPSPWKRRPLFVGAEEIEALQGGRTVELDIRTRLLGRLDLPILLALPELDCCLVRDRELAA
jgi:AraC-like DNA-binding protein